MKRIATFGTAALLASTMLAGVALAQPRSFGPGFGMGYGMGYGPGMMGQPGRGRSMMMDANDDGVVSAEEAASAADEVFSAMDADDDAALTKDEYMAVRMGPQLGYNSERQAAMQKAKGRPLRRHGHRCQWQRVQGGVPQRRPGPPWRRRYRWRRQGYAVGTPAAELELTGPAPAGPRPGADPLPSPRPCAGLTADDGECPRWRRQATRRPRLPCTG